MHNKRLVIYDRHFTENYSQKVLKDFATLVYNHSFGFPRNDEAIEHKIMEIWSIFEASSSTNLSLLAYFRL
jgi:hypothetical protein